MFSSFRNRFGIPGAISVIALVFAMLGGAYAASDNGGPGSKASASATKGPPGPRGKRGKPGPSGPAGPAGPAGAKGDPGAAGSNGADGAKGATGTTGPTGKTGPEGPKGATGDTGTSGFTETLPSGKTETGSWSLPAGPPGSSTAISFNIPLAAEIAGTNQKYIPVAVTPPVQCDNGAAPAPSPANPEADAGWICVYAAAGAVAEEGVFIQKSASSTLANGASRTGAVLIAFGAVTAGGGGFAGGTWAVTAP